MTKPLIGLTTSHRPGKTLPPSFGTNTSYAHSITDAGGLPVLIPLNLPGDDLDLVLSRLDGVLFTGGYDIDPRRYGSLPHPKVEGLDVNRDRVEMHLVHALIRQGKPFFGICRGCQVINVALGGSLYEDVQEQFTGSIQHDYHDRPRDYLAHNIDVSTESRLSQLLAAGSSRVNSLHHQGINRVARELKVTAAAPDGLAEAIELPDYPFGLAVQWHPEELQESASMRNLFVSFVQASQSNHSNLKVDL